MGFSHTDNTDEFDQNQVTEFINDTLINVKIDVTSQTVELKVGGANLVGRKFLRVTNLGKTVRVGLTGVTNSTGEKLSKNETEIYPYGDNISLYAKDNNSDDEIKLLVWEGK